MTNWLKTVSRERPVLIAGPTASGKSALAMEIAARDGRVIVNADALQVYDCWRVLTARPSREEEASLPHALYGHVGRTEDYSVGHWLRQASELLDRPVVVVGGTGLYFMALTEGLAQVPPIPAPIRAAADDLRLHDLAAMIQSLDAETREKIDLANPARVQRAWEVLQTTGQGLAVWQAATPRPLLPLSQAEAIVMRPSVDWLNRRIDLRFDQMIATGALEEVRANLCDWDPTRPSSRAIGAPELHAHLAGELSLSEAVERAKLASRQYAKRQRTWFRNRMKSWRELSLG